MRRRWWAAIWLGTAAITGLIVADVSLSAPQQAAANAAPAPAPPAVAGRASPAPGPVQAVQPNKGDNAPIRSPRNPPEQGEGPQPTGSTPSPGRPVRPEIGDHHHHHHELPYYPLGVSYSYWNPDWYPWGGGYGYDNNQPEYQGQFQEQGNATASGDEQNQPSANEVLVPGVGDDEPTTPQLHQALLASAQWREADERVKVARSRYNTASARVLGQLHKDPAYQQALDRKNKEAQQVDALKDKHPDASMTRTEPLATAKLDAAKNVTDMETAALAADPDAAAAKSELDAALAQRQEIRMGIQASIAGNRPAAAAPPP